MKKGVLLLLLVVVVLSVGVNGDSSKEILVKKVKGHRVCSQGWECKQWSKYCCNQTISDLFQVYQFEELFSKRNTPVAHAVGFWDYQSFILAAAQFEPLGFGTTGGKLMQMKEIAAFFGHVGSKTSCKFYSFTNLCLGFSSFIKLRQTCEIRQELKHRIQLIVIYNQFP